MSTTINEYPLPDLPRDPCPFMDHRFCTAQFRPVYLSGITAGPDGNVWFADTNGHAVGMIAPSGNITELVAPGSDPLDIVTGADGNLWSGGAHVLERRTLGMFLSLSA
jgi:hypothetical protein